MQPDKTAVYGCASARPLSNLAVLPWPLQLPWLVLRTGLLVALLWPGSGVISSGALAAVTEDSSQSSAKKDGIDPNNLPPEMTRSLEDLLDDPEGVEPDREETRCINRRIGVRTEILDSEHLLFRSAVGGKAWLNRLSPGCLGLRPDMVLVTEGRGSSVCQLDFVYGQSGVGGLGAPGIRTGRCSLGKFEPITLLHAKALEDTFKLRRKEMAEARRRERVEKRKARRKERSERRAQRRAARAAEVR